MIIALKKTLGMMLPKHLHRISNTPSEEKNTSFIQTYSFLNTNPITNHKIEEKITLKTFWT